MKRYYTYEGPVLEFNNLLVDNWRGGTWASSEKQARNNLAYQFKKNNNRTPTAKIVLPGNLVLAL